MARESFAHIGSGTVPFVGPWYPQLSGVFQQGKYPLSAIEGLLAERKGTNSVILNYADMSAFLGLEAQAISVSNSAVPLPSGPLENRRCLALCNLGPGILYIGKGPNVSTANGFPLFVNDKVSIDCQGNERVWVYGISDSTSDVRILELA